MKVSKVVKNKNIVEGLFFFLISVFFIKESLELHNNMSWALSPALFPLIVMTLLLLFSLALIISGLIENGENENNDNNQGHKDDRTGNINKYYRLIGFIALTIIYILVLPKIHFILSSIVYLFSLMLLLGERNIKTLILISVISPVIISYIFGNLLDVYLP